MGRLLNLLEGVNKFLDASHASRMERARAGEFHKEPTVYHGTGEDIESFDPLVRGRSTFVDEAGYGVDRQATHYAVFDPSNIRSVNAAFDPAKRDSANLLASAAGIGVLGASGESEASPVAAESEGIDIAQALGKGAGFVFDAIEIPTRGLHGLAAALGTAAEGGSFDQALNRGADVSRMSIPQISQHLGTYTADRTGNPYAAALVDALTNVVALEP